MSRAVQGGTPCWQRTANHLIFGTKSDGARRDGVAAVFIDSFRNTTQWALVRHRHESTPCTCGVPQSQKSAHFGVSGV